MIYSKFKNYIIPLEKKYERINTSTNNLSYLEI